VTLKTSLLCKRSVTEKNVHVKMALAAVDGDGWLHDGICWRVIVENAVFLDSNVRSDVEDAFILEILFSKDQENKYTPPLELKKN